MFVIPLFFPICLVFENDTFYTFFTPVIGRETKEVSLSLIDQCSKKKSLLNSVIYILVNYFVETKHPQKV